jgi:2,3-bisphosphoglycerate-independent phosphoglycerate mutase
MATQHRPKPTVLLILDGWGIAPPSRGNGIALAKKPVFEHLLATYPVTSLQASGEAVGLSWGEMGNSEVGHLNCGSGMIVYQTLPRINKAIEDESFYDVEAFAKAAAQAKKAKGTLHLVGMVSNGGVHSHQDHLSALLEMCKKQKVSKVAIHAILDGRDTKRDGGLEFIKQLQARIKQTGVGTIASLSGRFYAMDRDNHWDRIEKAYRAIVDGQSENKVSDPVDAIEKAYSQKIYDEEFPPAVVGDGAPFAPKDAVIFFNFRADRARQLATAFSVPGFSKFERPKFSAETLVVTMTEYEKNLPVEIAYPPHLIEKPLAKIVAEHHLTQLHAAETEKYAHVTFFINGGIEDPFPREDRILVPSPPVATYDQKPSMSVYELTDKVVAAIKTGKHDLIIVNFANPDMVGHTGVIAATVQAIQDTDACIGKLYDAVLQADGALMITADHGNAEELINLRTGEIDKEHSTNPVPFILAGSRWEGKSLVAGLDSAAGDLSILTPTGMLADITPTVLKLLEIDQPEDMTGSPVI